MTKTPTDAVSEYIDDRRIDDLSDETIARYRTVLTGFAEWLESRGENSIDVDPHVVNQYKLHKTDVQATATLKTELNVIHRFFRYCESNGFVSESVSSRILIPKSNASRDEELDSDTAEQVIEFLDRYRYASRDHAMVALAWHTSMRRGALRAIDLDDVEDGKIRLVNRPESDTRLKNGDDSERWVALNDRVNTILDDYITVNRISMSDDYSREPLFSTTNGRISVSAITDTFYRVTRPCLYAGECPDERVIDDCDAAQLTNSASECPFSLSSHPCRRGSITHHLRNDVPKQIVSDRADVSVNVLDEHYNQLSDQEKMEKRRGYLDNI